MILCGTKRRNIYTYISTEIEKDRERNQVKLHEILLQRTLNRSHSVKIEPRAHLVFRHLGITETVYIFFSLLPDKLRIERNVKDEEMVY